MVGCKITLKKTHTSINFVWEREREKNNINKNTKTRTRNIAIKKESTRTLACEQVTADLFGTFYHNFESECVWVCIRFNRKKQDIDNKKGSKRSKKKKLPNSKIQSINDDCKNTTENKCRQKQSLLTIKHFVAFLYSLFAVSIYPSHSLSFAFALYHLKWTKTVCCVVCAVFVYFTFPKHSNLRWYFSVEFFNFYENFSSYTAGNVQFSIWYCLRRNCGMFQNNLLVAV